MGHYELDDIYGVSHKSTNRSIKDLVRKCMDEQILFCNGDVVFFSFIDVRNTTFSKKFYNLWSQSMTISNIPKENFEAVGRLAYIKENIVNDNRLDIDIVKMFFTDTIIGKLMEKIVNYLIETNVIAERAYFKVAVNKFVVKKSDNNLSYFSCGSFYVEHPIKDEIERHIMWLLDDGAEITFLGGLPLRDINNPEFFPLVSSFYEDCLSIDIFIDKLIDSGVLVNKCGLIFNYDRHIPRARHLADILYSYHRSSYAFDDSLSECFNKAMFHNFCKEFLSNTSAYHIQDKALQIYLDNTPAGALLKSIMNKCEANQIVFRGFGFADYSLVELDDLQDMMKYVLDMSGEYQISVRESKL